MYIAKKLGRNQVRSTRDPSFQPGSDADDVVSMAPRTWSSLAVADAVDHLIDAGHRSNPYTQALSAISMKLAQTIGLSDEEAFKIGLAAELQNLGNVAIPDAVLQKTTSLTRDERLLVRRHPEVGADILAGVPAVADLAPIVRAHHEWWNGQGYPRGLKEEEIPIGARILAVVDVYKALTTRRPHRPARSTRTAFDELRFRSGTQFDPALVEGLHLALAPNATLSERVLVDAHNRAYRERMHRPVKGRLVHRSYLSEV
jgi:HD-GYP domain-containing protein (c-di-GMP phosphodiesterase class II)